MIRLRASAAALGGDSAGESELCMKRRKVKFW